MFAPVLAKPLDNDKTFLAFADMRFPLCLPQTFPTFRAKGHRGGARSERSILESPPRLAQGVLRRSGHASL